MTTYLKKDERYHAILKTAMAIAIKRGYWSINKRSLAKEGGFSETLVFKYFKSIRTLRRAVVAEGVATRHPLILMQVDSTTEGFQYNET